MGAANSPNPPDLELLERYFEGLLTERESAELEAKVSTDADWRSALDQVRSNRGVLDLVRAHHVAERDATPGHLPSVPGFELLHELHRGGQGIVFAARQISTDRRVALKLLLHGQLATSMQRRRFEREIDFAAGLTHPSIVKVFDRGDTADGRPYYAMELVEGQPLDAFLRERHSPMRDRLHLFCKIADAVSYAHQRAVMHRDLKPANILVDGRGDPRVLDFGLAKPAGLDAESIATQAGDFIGTLRYASPEQVQGDPLAIDVRTDVYSLSVILYEMLTDRLPYAHESPLSALVGSISTEAPIRPRAIAPRLDADLETILLKGLEKDPARRYQAASELAADVGRFLRSEPITARPPSAAYQLRKFAQRHKPVVAAIAASFVVLVAALIVVTGALIQESRARDAAQHRFDQVHALARTFIYDIHDDIKDLPGATRAREHLVEVALRYLDSLSEDPSADTHLRLDLAKAYERIGDVQGNPDFANLGDLSGAMTSYGKSLSLRQALSQATPADWRMQRDLGLSHERLGEIQMKTGESEAGLASFQRSLELHLATAGALPENSPDRIEVLRDVAAMRMKIGRACIFMSRDDEARDHIRRSLEERLALASKHPDREDLQREVSQSQVALGDEFRHAGDRDRALEEYGKAEAIRAELARVQEGNATALRDHALVLSRMGNIYRDTKRLDEAFEVFTRYHEISRSLAEADESNAEALRDLTVSLEKMGDVMLRMERHKESLDYFTQCADIRATVAAENPENVEAALDLSIARQFVGKVNLAMGNASLAREHFAATLVERRGLSERDPSNARLSRMSLASLFNIAETYCHEGDDGTRTSAHRLDSWRKAQVVLAEALVNVEAMRAMGHIADSDAEFLDRIAAEDARCHEAAMTLAAREE